MSDTGKAAMLEMKFVSAEDTEKLLQIIELALDDLDQVVGGMPGPTELPTRSPPPSSECACVNCCSSHPL